MKSNVILLFLVMGCLFPQSNYLAQEKALLDTKALDAAASKIKKCRSQREKFQLILAFQKLLKESKNTGQAAYVKKQLKEIKTQTVHLKFFKPSMLDMRIQAVHPLSLWDRGTSIILRGDELTAESIDAVTHLSAVRAIGIEDTTLDDAKLNLLLKVKHFKGLFFRKVTFKLSETGYKTLAMFNRLEHLYFEDCDDVKDRSFKFAKTIKTLKYLSYAHTPLRDGYFADVPKDSNIEFLNLAGTDITDDELKYMKGFKKLKYLSLRNLDLLTNDGVNNLKDNKALKQVVLINSSVKSAAYLGMLKILPDCAGIQAWPFSVRCSLLFDNVYNKRELSVGYVHVGDTFYRMGLLEGDVILEIDGTKVKKADDVRKYLLDKIHESNTKTLKIKRGKETITLKNVSRGKVLIGFYYGLARIGGLYVVSVKKDSFGEKIDMRRGDIIIKINDTDIKTEDDFTECLKFMEGVDEIKTITVKRQKDTVVLSVENAPKTRKNHQPKVVKILPVNTLIANLKEKKGDREAQIDQLANHKKKVMRTIKKLFNKAEPEFQKTLFLVIKKAYGANHKKRPIDALKMLEQIAKKDLEVSKEAKAYLASDQMLFDRLRHTDFFFNMRGQAPLITDIKSMKARKTLYFWEQGIGDADLKYFKKLPNLERIEFMGAKVGTKGLGYLKDCPKLKELKFARVKIGIPEVKALANIKTFESLNVERSKIDAATIEELCKNEKLTTLVLLGEKITDECLTHIAKHKKIKVLNLHRSGIKDSGLAILKNMKQLTHLNLGTCPITDKGMAELSGLTALINVNLFKTKVTDKSMKVLQKFVSLGYLDLSETKITEAALKEISKMVLLQYLFLDKIALTDDSLDHLTKLPNIKVLTLQKTGITVKAIPYFKKMPSLRRLCVTETGLRPAGIKQIFTYFREKGVFLVILQTMRNVYNPANKNNLVNF